MTRFFTDQQGAMIPWVAAAIAMLIMALALSVEVTRALNERERLTGATEAAALAGALNAKPILQLRVDQSRWRCIQNPDGTETCGWDYRTVPVTGLEADVVPNWTVLAGCGAGGWKCPMQPVVICRGVTYPQGTSQAMSYAFDINRNHTPGVTSHITSASADAKTARTEVSARGRFVTTLGRILGRTHLDYQTRSVGFSELRPLPWPDPKVTCP